MSPRQYYVPNLPRMIDFPWSGIHTMTEQATNESVAWLDDLGILGSQSETKDFFDRTQAGILGGYTYPYANYNQLRACTDFINTIYVLDEITDVQSGKNARVTMVNHLDVLFGEVPDGSSISQMSVE